MNYNTSALLVGAVLFFIVALPLPTNGLGVSPAHTDVSGIYIGSIINKNIAVSREQTATEEILLIDIQGDAAAAINGAPTLVFPRGISQQPYPFTIDTTKLNKERLYRAQIMFSPKSNVSEVPTTILTGLKADIQFTVTRNRKEEFHVSHAKIEESKEWQALMFSYFLVNSGNVQTRPAKIIIAITDLKNKQQVANETIPSEKLPIVAPFYEQTVTIPTTIMLPTGQYAVTASFFNDYATPMFKEQFPLQVTLPDGRMTPIKNTFFRRITPIILYGVFVLSAGALLFALAKRR